MALHDITGNPGSPTDPFPTVQMPDDGDAADASDFEDSTIQPIADSIAVIRHRTRGLNPSGMTQMFHARGIEVSPSDPNWEINKWASIVRAVTLSGYAGETIAIPVSHLIPGIGRITAWGIWVCGGAHSALPEHQFSARLLYSPSPVGYNASSAVPITEVSTAAQAETVLETFNTIRQLGPATNPNHTIDPIGSYVVEVTGPYGTDSVEGAYCLGGFISISGVADA